MKIRSLNNSEKEILKEGLEVLMSRNTATIYKAGAKLLLEQSFLDELLWIEER